MTSSKLECSIVGLLVAALLCHSCSSTRLITNSDSPGQFTELMPKDLNKKIKVYLRNGEVKSGSLRGFSRNDLTLRSKKNQIEILSFDTIKEVRIESPSQVPLVIAVFVGGVFVLYKLGAGMGAAAAGAGT